MADFSLKHKVTVHYTGSFEDGEVFDTTEGRTPLTYIEGNHEVVPGFERTVLGMEPGEKKRVRIEPKEAYGERNPALLYSMPTMQIPMNGEGYQQLARVVRIQDDGDTVFDFNHPMAGHTLTFDLELIAREPLEKDEDAHA